VSRAAESTHWYSRDGLPMYDLMGSNGKMRPTTLRDARKLNLVPSVTGIIRCAAAPGLERWKLDQMMQAALTLPRRDGESEKDWIARVWTDSGETARKAAERGTAIHAACQGHYEGESPCEEFWPHVQGTVAAVNNWAGARNDWIAEKAFAHPLGFGGKTDLHCPHFLLDFKSKEFDENTELKTWDEQAMQLAANREGQGFGMARCAIVYVSVTTPGLARLIEIPEEELSRGWEMFVFLLSYWKAKNKFRCGFSEEKRAA
jgi:hypothetical protein